MSEENRWTEMGRQVAERIPAESARLAKELRGGRVPPGKVRKSDQEQLREYLLLCQPIETLSPPERAEADAIWAGTPESPGLAGREHWEVIDYCLAMEKIRLKQAPQAGQGAMIPPAAEAAPVGPVVPSGGIVAGLPGEAAPVQQNPGLIPPAPVGPEIGG